MDEFTFSTNYRSTGSYYELIIHNTTDNNNIVTNKYANPNRQNPAGALIWFIVFLISTVILFTYFF